mgnify:CR=1 FL=1
MPHIKQKTIDFDLFINHVKQSIVVIFKSANLYIRFESVNKALLVIKHSVNMAESVIVSFILL